MRDKSQRIVSIHKKLHTKQLDLYRFYLNFQRRQGGSRGEVQTKYIILVIKSQEVRVLVPQKKSVEKGSQGCRLNGNSGSYGQTGTKGEGKMNKEHGLINLTKRHW